MYTWCYDGLTVYPRVIQIWKPFWFKEANIFDNNNNKNFYSYNASDIDGVLQYNELCQHDWVGFVAV